MNRLLKNIVLSSMYLVYAWLCFLMVEIAAQYITLESDVAFLRIKQQFVHLWYYRFGFFAHALFTLLVLPAGFTQFSKNIRSKYSRLHRLVGKIYVFSVLFIAAPSGLLLAIYANGGWSSQLAFSLLAILWFFTTWIAFRKIRLGEIKEHQKYMIRSYALALSAITLRAWKYAIVAIFHPRPMDVYQIVAWLGWVLNLAVAELIILKWYKK
jgi:uncharacterized membrane protein